MTREELDKFAEEVENRPYLEYEETTDEELKEVLSEKELREIKGIGPINKVKKFFRDIIQAREIKASNELRDFIDKRSVIDIIPEEYLKELAEDESNEENN